MVRDFLAAFVFFAWYGVKQLVYIVLGVVLCLWPKTERVEHAKPFTQHPREFWFPVDMAPDWLWPWNNQEDGARGDHRGWYWMEYNPWFWLGLGHFNAWKYYWWLAIRNPANNYKRYRLGADVSAYTMETVAGQDFVRDDYDSTGFQLVKATPKSDENSVRWHLYWVLRYGKTKRALVVEFGNKVQVRHNGIEYSDPLDYWKGFTLELNPIKDIS